MPRCHIRCNIITDPEKGGLKKLRPLDIKPYLAGTFHVPVKEIYAILGMSHHTLAPLRRELGLSRWPFADICRGEFRMDGVRQSWDDVEEARKSLMLDADERIIQILDVMGERALKHKHRVNLVVMARLNKAKKTKVPDAIVSLPQAATTSAPESVLPKHETTTSTPLLLPPISELLLETPKNETIANRAFAGEDFDWEGLSELLLRHLDAPAGSLFPRPEELFP